jgi:hypothetical protein
MQYRLEDINESWDRYYKGYYYEMIVQETLSVNNIEYIGNPIDIDEWKKTTNTDYDISVKVSDSSWLDVECKLTLSPHIYNSWFERDWFSRNCNIIVTNNKFHLSMYARNKLYIEGIALVNTESLVPYIKGIIEGNKSTLLTIS